MKFDALLFLRTSLETHQASVMQDFIPQILPMAISAVSEDWYKIIAEALRVLDCIIMTARPLADIGEMRDESDFDFTTIILPIYQGFFSYCK